MSLGTVLPRTRTFFSKHSPKDGPRCLPVCPWPHGLAHNAAPKLCVGRASELRGQWAGCEGKEPAPPYWAGRAPPPGTGPQPSLHFKASKGRHAYSGCLITV